MVIGDDLWKTVSDKEEVKAKKREDKVSYLWDALIETYIQGIQKGHAYFSPGILAAEPAIRKMALESRFMRRVLSKALLEFIDLAKARKVRSRMLGPTQRKTIYVLLAAHDEDHNARIAELTARCWVARDTYPDCKTVVGLAMLSLEPGSPLDLLYFYLPNWTEHEKRKAKEAREELGFFKKPVRRGMYEDEYPASPPIMPVHAGKVGRNERCPCGSGRKYKHCHGRN